MMAAATLSSRMIPTLTSLGVDTSNGLPDGELDLYAEGWINFHSEVAVMVVRSTTCETRAYPTVTAIQTDSICRVVLAPARNVPADIRSWSEEIDSRAVDSLGDGATGMFGVELFLVKNASGSLDVLLNEVAPRPHNTGHYTQDACAVSQFENHLRGVCGLPLGDTSMSVGAAASEFGILLKLFPLIRPKIIPPRARDSLHYFVFYHLLSEFSGQCPWCTFWYCRRYYEGYQLGFVDPACGCSLVWKGRLSCWTKGRSHQSYGRLTRRA